jgi:hypothetical protein
MAVAGRTGDYDTQDMVTKRIALLWHEAEASVRSGDLARAQRYFRWILSVCPEDIEAWLYVARLAADPQERLRHLLRAYSLAPNDGRVQAALRQARAEQLESAVGELRAKPAVIHFLPDERRVSSKKYPWSNGRPLRFRPREAAKRSLDQARRILPTLAKNASLWLAFLLPLAVYLSTACSTVYNLDSAEFSAAAHVLGIVRATGYPLYLLLGKAFTSLFPVGEMAFRLNVMSAVCAAGTVVLLYQFLRRLVRQRAAALAASLLLAFSYYFWAQAVVAEVYTLHTLLVVIMWLALARWEQRRADGLLAVFALFYGLSFGNHMSTILLAPGFALFLLATAGKELFRPKRLLVLGLPFLAGLGIYAYVPLRYLAQPAFNYAGYYDAAGQFVALDMTRPANLWWLISGQGFQGLMFDYSMPELLDKAVQAAHRLWGNFLGIGLVPGLLGAWFQARRRPRHFGLLGLIFLANMAFFINYRVIDKETMFVTAYLVWAVWVGEGCAYLVRWVQGLRGLEERRSPAWAWGLAAMALVALIVNWPLVNIRTDTRARDRAAAALGEANPNAIIFGWWTSVPPIHYLQVVEEQRSDVLVINRFLIGAEEMYTLINDSLGQRPVYVMELDEGLIGAYRPVQVGPMFELTPREWAGAEP